VTACTKCGYDPDVVYTEAWTATAKSYAPSVNKIGINGKNNHQYRQWRKSWAKLFGEWLKSLPVATKRRRVSITRMYGKNERPHDRINFAAGCKPLLDVIVEYGGLYDDSAAWCEDHYEQKKSPDGKDYVIVTIEEIPNE
jgi:hypothetical protein